MKLLALSDQVVASIYSPSVVERFGDVDIVVACGDLPYSYLEFVATMLNVPCFFVHGNHDCAEYTSCGLTLTGPGGWADLDGRTARSKGIILGGLEGALRYRPDAPFQYTELEMAFKVWRMTLGLLRNRMLHGRYLDILITHAPPFGVQDGEDRTHRGFRALLAFMARFRPRYLLHGHNHPYGMETRESRYLDTEVVNVCPFRVIEWQPAVVRSTRSSELPDGSSKAFWPRRPP